MRKVKIRTRLVGVSALSVLVGAVIYNLPLVKFLIWLNAAGVASRWGSPRMFVWLAWFEVALIVAICWVALWKLGSSIYDRA